MTTIKISCANFPLWIQNLCECIFSCSHLGSTESNAYILFNNRYGKVLRSHLFGSPTIISCDHELNAFVLQNEDRLFQCSYPKPIHGILGKLSMLVVVGDAHKRLRGIALGLTNTWKSKIGILHDIDRQVISMMESWKKRERIIFCEEARKARGIYTKII